MENAADLTARRRVSRILGHVSGSSPSDEALPPSSLLLLHCSGTLNTLIQRRDGRLLFARQGSRSRGRFMHQVSSNPQESAAPNFYPHNASCEQKCGEPPLFSRKATAGETAPPSSRSIVRDAAASRDGISASSDAPLFARKSAGLIENQQQAINSRRQQPPDDDTEWCPRMDVAESAAGFLVTVELPGVQPTEIHLQVDNENLTIMGKRSVRGGRMEKGGCCGESSKGKSYHKREISEGPFRIVWPLPGDVNKDAVSADLLDGFLRITLPKL